MDPIALDAEELSDVPELTNAAVNSARWNPQVGCLIDRAQPGRPLLLSFGFVDWQALPIFDFFGRTKKLEKTHGARFNRILVRDVANAWYHRGVPGLGTHVDDVAATLRSIVRSIRPSEVVTIGQSMGGYAALMFGMLLGARRIVAFGPLSHLDPAVAACYGDRRFLPVMEGLQAEPPRSAYFDLVELGRALDYSGEIHIVFGTHPGHDDGVSSNLDAIHAFRLARLRNVVLHPCPESDHAVVHWLIENHKIDALLARLLLGDRSPAAATAATATADRAAAMSSKGGH